MTKFIRLGQIWHFDPDRFWSWPQGHQPCLCMVIALHTVAEYRAGRPGTLTSVNLDETIKGALGDLGAVTVLESSGRIYELSPFQFCPGSATCTLFADAPDDSVQGDPG